MNFHDRIFFESLSKCRFAEMSFIDKLAGNCLSYRARTARSRSLSTHRAQLHLSANKDASGRDDASIHLMSIKRGLLEINKKKYPFVSNFKYEIFYIKEKDIYIVLMFVRVIIISVILTLQFNILSRSMMKYCFPNKLFRKITRLGERANLQCQTL